MYNIIINQDLCKKCKICMEFCPRKVFIVDDKGGLIIPKYKDKCIGCKWCEYRCPDFAIKVEVND